MTSMYTSGARYVAEVLAGGLLGPWQGAVAEVRAEGGGHPVRGGRVVAGERVAVEGGDVVVRVTSSVDARQGDPVEQVRELHRARPGTRLRGWRRWAVMAGIDAVGFQARDRATRTARIPAR